MTGETSTGIIQQIAGIIQSTYGDATQAELDRRCASAIYNHLIQSGWISPDIVRALIASAGGEIHLQEEFLLDPPDVLVVHSPTWDGTRRITVKRSNS